MSNAGDAIEKKKLSSQNVLRKALYVGMEKFRKYETENELSGRPGLKVQNGTLRNSFHTTLSGMGHDIIATLRNQKNAWYGIVHQTGKVISPKSKGFLAWKYPVTIIGKRGGLKHTTDWVFTKKSVTIPKRLHFYENFNSYGKAMIKETLVTAMKTI